MKGDPFCRGDTWLIPFEVSDSDDNLIDFTYWQIRFEISGKEISIKKGNSNVPGGSNDQIRIKGMGQIEIKVPKDETSKCNEGTYQVELEITSPDGDRFTVVTEHLQVMDDLIKWNSVTGI